ncbi:MAG TPA: LPXTG cell wall anchor domain-containing protein [Glycomyces sp.]|nr:LPXTG cell wall anchor domain-containing protein [Glycomyces sp.]
MKTIYSRGAAIAAAALLPWGMPTAAHAAEMPDEAVLMYLKHHAELPLAWTGDSVALSADGDRWTFKAVESFQDLGEHLIVHDESGRCLTAHEIEASDEAEPSDRTELSDQSGAVEEPESSGGAESSEETEARTPEYGEHKDVEYAPVTLGDCAGATEWTVVYDDAKVNQDYRFATPDGFYLGLEPGAEAVEGAEVHAVGVESSKHSQEWRFAAPHEPPPGEEPEEEPSEAVGTTPVAARPELPRTGAGMTIVGGVGLTAVAAGAAMALWWRRRTLRGDW